MKIIRFICCFILISALAGCSQKTENKIKIAIMGCEDTYEEGYLNGINLAIKENRRKYPEYDIEAVFYDDNESYTDGAAIVNIIASDEEITAVIGSQTPAICENAAYTFDAAKIPTLTPYTVYDSMLNNNNYSYIFSMCHSQESVGKALYRAMEAEYPGKKTIALCYCEDQSGKDEARSFAECINADGEVIIADYVKLHDLSLNFNNVYSRWETLGVDVVVIMPYDIEGFDILKRIKERNPDMIMLGDFMFDNLDEIEKADSAFDGFLFADPFYNSVDYDAAGSYEAEYGEQMGKWAAHGYDAVTMIVNAAVNSEDTASYLRENEYKQYSFDEKGRYSGE
ncbi:MAG: ABC transporter substrate-binding protein, partial [Oscillospiraceae bacterium]|nr:ABC transporter substrate-binding protein [Oscillospiraceae bacterium]